MFKYRCLQGFAAEGPGELSINANDIVIAASNQDTDGWIQVKSLRGGAEGFVPFGYLEFVKEQQTAPPPAATSGFQAQPTVPYHSGQAPLQSNQFAHPTTVPESLQQPSVEHVNSPTSPAFNPFDTSALQSSLPGTLPENEPVNTFQNPPATAGTVPPPAVTAAPAPAKPLTANDRNNRHSYVPSQDQYQVTNPTQFQETLELWRERERRFMKGEPERLPEAKKREYYYWNRLGERVGPLSEEEMRAKFDTRELSADTKISLQVGNETLDAVSVQQYFPDVHSAFQKAPVVQQKTNTTMWMYRDDLGQVQGPFSADQMRAWFQDGYFNAETLVRLANQTDDEFVQLGLLFPEGEGAFLSEGDQIGAKAKQAEINSQMFSGGFAAAGGPAAAAAAMPPPAYDPNAFTATTTGTDAGLYGNPNPFDSGYGTAALAGGAAAAATSAWGGPEQAYVPPPSQPSLRTLQALDPYATGTGTGTDDGKALFVEALAGTAPPPAIGATSGAPPAALQAQQSDDWGITWDDEPEWQPPPATGADQPPPPAEEAHPVTVAENEEDEEEAPKVTQFSELQTKYLNSVDSLYIFLTRSVPKKLGVIRCKIKRSVVGLHVNYNLYECYLEREDGSLGPQILTSQKHRRYGIDSYYNIAIGSVNKKEKGKVISSLIFNTLGTHFICHNNVSAHKGKPRDLCCVLYQRNLGKGPRKFSVGIPAQKDGSETEQVEWPHQGGVKKSKMLQNLVSLDFKGLTPLINRKPTWSKKHSAWVLNFHGRVTRSSVKNFQLVRPDDNNTVILQFGRIGTDTFTMDLQWPMSPVAAMSVATSALHNKFSVE